MTALDILSEALLEAVRIGIPVTGWTMQADGLGYAAWLYYEPADADTQQPLWPSSEYHRSAQEAAAWVLLQVRAMGEPS